MYSLRNRCVVSQFILLWIYHLVYHIKKEFKQKSTSQKIEFQLNDALKARHEGARLQAILSTQNGKQLSLKSALFSIYGKTYIFIGLWKIIWAACIFVNAYLFLRLTVAWSGDPASSGILYGMGVFFSGLCEGMAVQQLIFQSAKVGLRVKNLF